jgi:cyanophycin synthetase
VSKPAAHVPPIPPRDVASAVTPDSGAGASAAGVQAVEVRLLEGPNLYFTRPAVKVTLNFGSLATADRDSVKRIADSLGLRRTAPGTPGTAQRQRALLRLSERVVRRIAAASGTRRLGVRTRPGSAPESGVVAFVWRDRGRARVLGDELAPMLQALAEGVDPASLLESAAERVRAGAGGEPPRVVTASIPVASVTGTNGKTTTTRLLGHMGMVAGRHTAWSSTDGIVDNGSLVEPGDYSGPAGARGVLSVPGVELGILETARGGMLLKGLGVAANDVSVVTNVSADHLGLQGIDTVDQLAEVKAIITKVTKTRGWCVLNGDDPRVWAMRTGTPARPWVFTMDPNSPAIREALADGGRAMTILDGSITALGPHGEVDRLAKVLDVPTSLAGLSRHNIANALAAAAAGLALGLPRAAVVEAMRTFEPDDQLNPGRMNVYSVPVAGDSGGSITVILDLAHNEAGLEALLDVARGLVAPGGRVHLALGTAGDRTDEILENLGEIAGLRADHVVTAHKEDYLRGRTREGLEGALRTGLSRAGVAEVTSLDSEIDALGALAGSATEGDVVALMCHAQRVEADRWVVQHGGTPDSAATIRRKVIAARGEHELEAEIAALWTDSDAERRIETGRALYAANPGDTRIVYEYAGTYDSAGREEEAVAGYEEALAAGLAEPYRHRAQIQLASTLRNLGRHEEAAPLIEEVVAAHPDSLGAAAFRALILHDAGRPAAALGGLLQTLARQSADADVARYRRSLAAYGQDLEDR